MVDGGRRSGDPGPDRRNVASPQIAGPRRRRLADQVGQQFCQPFDTCHQTAIDPVFLQRQLCHVHQALIAEEGDPVRGLRVGQVERANQGIEGEAVTVGADVMQIGDQFGGMFLRL